MSTEFNKYGGYIDEATLKQTILNLQIIEEYLEEYFSIFDYLLTLVPFSMDAEMVIKGISELVDTKSTLPVDVYNMVSTGPMGYNNPFKSVVWSMENCLTIAFEGIDATGKQTLSNMFKQFLEFTCAYHKMKEQRPYLKLSTDQKFIKVNIPNYSSESGKRISGYLNSNNYNTELLQLEFAINRKEVQNLIEDYNNSLFNIGVGYENTLVCIFDRWIDSGMAFKLAKVLITMARNPSSNSYEVTMDTLLDQTKLEIFLNSSLGDKLWEQYIVGQELIEYETLRLIKPNFKVLCTSPTNVIRDRLNERAKATGIALDHHEKDLDFLEVVQSIYAILFADQYNKQNQKYLILDTSKETKEACVAEIAHKLLVVVAPDIEAKEIEKYTRANFGTNYTITTELSEQIDAL